jgi:hypothetical protein
MVLTSMHAVLLQSPSGVRGAISIFEKKASESRSTTPQKAVGARGSLTSYGGL